MLYSLFDTLNILADRKLVRLQMYLLVFALKRIDKLGMREHLHQSKRLQSLHSVRPKRRGHRLF